MYWSLQRPNSPFPCLLPYRLGKSFLSPTMPKLWNRKNYKYLFQLGESNKIENHCFAFQWASTFTNFSYSSYSPGNFLSFCSNLSNGQIYTLDIESCPRSFDPWVHMWFHLDVLLYLSFFWKLCFVYEIFVYMYFRCTTGIPRILGDQREVLVTLQLAWLMG